MAGKANTLSKKTIIAIATIIVLLLIAGISVGIFLADKGKTEAVDNKEVAENRIDNENKDNNDEKQDPSVQNPENQGNKNNQTPNTDGNQTANNNQTTNNNQTANNNQTTNNNATNNNTNRNNENNNTANNTQTTGNNGTTNNGVTTGTNVNEVGETTITRVEEGEEKVVAKKFWDWWNPMSVVVASTTANINAEKPEIVVEKSATTEAGENLVYAGEQIKYTINVTNNSKKDVENIEVTDKIPANTTFASINNDGTTITEGNDIVGVKWVISIPAGETKTVEFTVTVNQTMVDENGETVETKGFINNKAIANGEESNEVKTSIIKSKKTSAILRDKEQVEKAKIGDTIIYYISVENTGDVAGTTTITDYVPEGTELKSNVLRGGNVINDEKGTKVEWKDIEVPAGKTKTVFFMVEVKDIDGIIRNVATVGGKDTNEEDVGTTDIEIIKNVTDIKRNGVSIGKDAKVQAEDVIEYELVVTNTGSEKLTNVVVTDELAGIELTDGKWIIGDLASKEQKTIKAKYTVKYEEDIKGNAEKTVTNYAVVTGTSVPVIPEETPEEVSDDDDVTTPVEDTPKLEIEKTSTAVNGKPIVEGKTKVRAGDIIEYTITVKNTGNVELKDVIVTDNNTVRVGDTTYTVEEGAENVVIKTIPSIAVGETAEAIKAYYTVTENDVKEAGKIYNLATATSEKTTDEDDDDNVVVNENTTVTAKKVWEDNNNQDGIRPESIELTLYADGAEYKDEKTNQTVNVTVTPEQKSDKEWSYVFEGLPTYNKDGGKIKYTIVETNIGTEYKTTYSQDGLTVTNTHEPYTVDIDITKAWVDNDNQDGKRSQTVTVNLKKGETVIGEAKELSEANNWKGKWEKLPKYENGTLIDYNVEEVGTIDGYTVSVSPKETAGNVYSYTITNTHEVEKTSVTVNKEWLDENNQDGIRPETVTLILKANGTEVQRATVGANDNWSKTFENLPVYANGEKIVYTVDEETVTTGYTKTVEGMTVKNSHTPATTSITVNKEWLDENNQDGIRPETVTLILKANGTEVQRATVGANENWSKTFENLPVYANGEKIVYTVDEETVTTGYTKTVEGMTVKNSHTPATTSITVNKKWLDENNQDGIRPETVTLILKANGTEVQRATVGANENWSKTFENLPVYANGEKIVYTVDEETVTTGYTKTIKGMTVINTHKTVTTEVTAKKEWHDNNNQDGIRPKKISISLKNKENIIDTVELTEANNWSTTFKDLPKYENEGTLINYTIVENTIIPGYKTSINNDTEIKTITNTHVTDTTKIDAIKTWDDNNNQDGIRPETVTLILKASGTEVQRATVGANDNWSKTFENLPVYANGEKIVYTVDEETVTTGYTKTVEGMTVKNSHTPATTSITVNKEWLDESNQDGIRPETVTLILKANGTEVQRATVGANENWSKTFENLPVYANGEKIVYTVDEETVTTGYTKTVEGMTVKNSHTPATTSITVNKKWLDENNQDGIRPETVTLILKANGTEVQRATVGANENWSKTFENLPVYANGEKIVYTVDEETVTTGYTKTVEGMTVTNSRTPETTSVTVNKEWLDEHNQDGIRPDSITVRLLADGKEVKDATIKPDNSGNWTYTWSGLAKYKAGQLINYTVSEDAVDGYTTSTPTSLGTTTNGYVGTITNTHEIEKTSVTVNKEWIDGNNQDGIRPDSVNITLDATITNSDGKEETITIPEAIKTITLNEGNTWTYTWAGLDKYKNGKEIKYTVAENNEDERYTVSIKQNNKTTANGYDYTVTNSYTPEKTSVKVNKVWTDADNQDGIRPDSVSITLTATITNTNGEKENVTIPGTVTRTITLNEGNKWAYTWSGLDKNKAGQKIEYTVVENNVKTGYSVSVVPNNQTAENGYDYTVTNSHTPETTSVTVNKEWNDDSNRDGKRPGSITVRLLADGNQAKDANNNDLIATITPDNSGNWTYTWSGLAKYKAGQKINYTVSENTVENYNENNEQQPEITLEEKTENSYVYKIKNTHTPETINIPVTKEWKDNDYIEARGDKIIVDLYAGTSKAVKTIEITSANGWKGAFNDLPKYKAGKLIEYSIKERAVDRYITSITGNSETGFTITNKYQNVIVNKNVVKSVMNEEKFNSKLDFVFVIDTSGSMNEKYNNVKKAQTMVNALNSTMATILENENNRVGVVGYSSAYGGNESHSSVILGLDYYTAENNEFINLEEGYNSTYIQANAKNSSGTKITNYRYVEGATYTQAGIRDGANLLINSSHEEGRIPVIILLTDGEPTRSTQNYSNVGGYNSNGNYGDGSNSTSKSAFYTIMSAKHYKDEVNKAYKTKTNTDIARFFTIGIGMKDTDLYANTLLNPDDKNVTDCSKSNSWTKTYGIYDLMKQNYEKTYGRKTFINDKLNYYSYSDGAFIGNMDEEKLKNILKKTMESIKTYEKETTKTTNIDVDTAIIELEHLDIEKKIEIKINGEATEYTVQELKDNNVVTQTGSKYYMDLNADMFKNKKTIEITYYQVSLLNN